uniref:Uncharacterized protein n=3 Tax=Homalodisca liturata TaxID=320908 RepID=A0A1B6HV12_9HEMI
MLVQGEVEAMEDTGVEVLVGEDTVREVTTRAVPITIPSLPHSRAGLGNKATVLPVVVATKLTVRLRKEPTNMTKEASLTIPNLHLPVAVVAQPIVAMVAKEAITVAMEDTAIRVGVVTVAEVTIKEAAAVVTIKEEVVVGATTKVAVAMAVKEVAEATIKEVVVEAMEEVVAMKEAVEVVAAAVDITVDPGVVLTKVNAPAEMSGAYFCTFGFSCYSLVNVNSMNGRLLCWYF